MVTFYWTFFMLHLNPKITAFSSQKNNGYKSGHDQFDQNEIMSPISTTFKLELVPSADGAKEGDKLFSAKKVKTEEEIASGSFGCFIPENRMGISEMLQDMKRILNQHEQRILAQDQKIVAQDQKIVAQDQKIQRLNVQVLNNNIVQLMYGLVHAKVLKIVPRAKSLFPGKLSFRFEDVTSCDKIDMSTKEIVRQDATCARLRSLMDRNFKSLVRSRNSNTHPNVIKLETTKEIISSIQLDNLLDGEYLATFDRARILFNELENLDELESLIDIFNRSPT